MIVRDHKRAALNWHCSLWDFVVEPLLLENLACEEALLLAQCRSFYHIIVEDDAEVVINKLKFDGLLRCEHLDNDSI